MKTNIQFSEISNELYNIFSDDRRAVAYMADSFGPQYIGLCGWAGPMSPANRAAFVEAFGQDVTDRAEAEARARVDEYRAAVAASVYHRHELEADTFAASYGTPEKSQFPAVGSFVWGRWSCLKGECGPLGELEDLERMDSAGRENPRRLCEVVAVVDATPAEFMDRNFANDVARQFQQLGGSRWDEGDPLRLDGEPMTWELVFCVRCGARWYLIDGQGYDYTRYFLMPEDFREMYADDLFAARRAREDAEAAERAEEERQAAARLADYVARCARWSPLMEDVRPLVEAERAAYGGREKSQIRKASAKLSAARRRNLVAMASAIFPGVKFSAKKWDGWGGSYELTWTDGPTEEHLQEAGDFDLLERSRDTFDGWNDSSDTVFAEFADFADKYFALGGQIRFSREVSDEFRQSIADRIRAAVPGLPEDERARIYDNGQQSAICGMFREVDGVALSHLCDHLERGGLRDAAAYLARCMDGTPAHQDEPTDPTDGGGSPAPSYGDSEKSQHQETPEGLTLADIPGGVAVVGDSRTTYRHRRDIKARGAKWNKAAQQWEATGPEAIANLREWLAAPESAPAPADDAPSTMVEETAATAPELPAPPAAVVYDPAQPVERAEFRAEDAQGAAYGDSEKSQNPEAMRAEARREEVCDWYCYEYPTDEEGVNIRAGVTFADIMAHPEKIYNYIPGDSIIRERIFRETATRYGVEYSEIYGRWLDAPESDPTDGGDDSPAPSYGDAEKSPVPDHLADIYQRAKAKCAADAALFHCGDWFTAYGEDADRVADAVGIIITTTRDEFRKASFPFTALDTYLPRMVRQGMKVCICDAPRQAEPSRREKVAQEV